MTIVAHDRKDLFGAIENGQMTLSEEGKLVRQAWFDLPRHYANVCLDEEDFGIMPNHVHGIVVLLATANSTGRLLKCDLTEIMRAFKSFSAQRINQQRGISGVPVWQRSFYERILAAMRANGTGRANIFYKIRKIGRMTRKISAKLDPSAVGEGLIHLFQLNRGKS